jgi:DNA ligase-1
VEDVRRAVARVTDPGVVAVLARDDRLDEARLAIGRPVSYMLATPLEAISSALDPAAHVVEDKIDGIRAQVHKSGAEIAIFARGLERVTSAFPEVAEAFRRVRGDVVLDGELVALSDAGRPRPFQTLQPRLNRQVPTPEMVAATPVTFIAYDLLADDDGPHLDEPWTERRARLEAFARERAPASRFVLNACAPLGGDASQLAVTLDERFAAARARGHEGVVLKRTDALYDAGRRGQSWVKVKRAFATLDVVVTAAQEGNGRRAGTLSDYTFAVWSGEELVNVGKAYSGLTDAEIDAMSRVFEKATLERFGGVRLVRPEVVLEVGFDGIQRSRRHKSGFALRFPRIIRIRTDKTPDAADRLDAVEALYASQLESGHREDAPAEAAPPAAGSRAPGKRAPGKTKTGAEASAQLDLFGAPRRR